jgi:hypothetical protein
MSPDSRAGRWIGWVMLLVWATWCQGSVAWLSARPSLAAWTPDLGVLLFLAVAARLGRKLMARKRETVGHIGLLVAVVWAESANSSLGLAPILAGWMGVLIWQDFWRRGVDVEQPLLRILMGGSAALGLLLWRHLVIAMELSEETRDVVAGLQLADQGAWRGVLLTAALAPLLMPLGLALPGLGLYWRER